MEQDKTKNIEQNQEQNQQQEPVNLPQIVEALIFASEKPITIKQILSVLNIRSKKTDNKKNLGDALIQEALPDSDIQDREEESELEEITEQEVNNEKTSEDETQEQNDEDLTEKVPVIKFTAEEILEAIEIIKIKYNEIENNAIQLVQIADAYQLRTNSLYGKYIKRLNIAKPVKLTKAALETLAILAYKQPITKTEIDSIRGVDSGYSIRFLIEKKLAKILGKKEIPGKPLIYGTSQEFLSIFNLKNLSSLPTLREFRELTEKHAEKVKELFEEPSLEQLKEEAAPLDAVSDDDLDDLAEIDKALNETRKIKTVDAMLKTELFQDKTENEAEETQETEESEMEPVDETPEDLENTEAQETETIEASNEDNEENIENEKHELNDEPIDEYQTPVEMENDDASKDLQT